MVKRKWLSRHKDGCHFIIRGGKAHLPPKSFKSLEKPDMYVSQLYHPRSPPLEMWKEVALDFLGEVRNEIPEIADSKESEKEMEEELEQIIEKVKKATHKGTLVTVAKHIMPPLDKTQLETCMYMHLRSKKLIPYKPMKSELILGKLKQRLSEEFDLKKGGDYK